MLAGLGMLAGVAVARFVKASSEERYSDYRRTSQQWPTRSGGGASSSDGADLRRRGSIDEPVGEMSRMPAALSDEGLARDPYAGKR
jgi:hypothetical protein